MPQIVTNTSIIQLGAGIDRSSTFWIQIANILMLPGVRILLRPFIKMSPIFVILASSHIPVMFYHIEFRVARGRFPYPGTETLLTKVWIGWCNIFANGHVYHSLLLDGIRTSQIRVIIALRLLLTNEESSLAYMIGICAFGAVGSRVLCIILYGISNGHNVQHDCHRSYSNSDKR